MEWKLVEDEVPPLYRSIIFCSKLHAHDSSNGIAVRNKFRCIIGFVTRPFDVNIKYNPDYYEVEHEFVREYKISRLSSFYCWLDFKESLDLKIKEKDPLYFSEDD